MYVEVIISTQNIWEIRMNISIFLHTYREFCHKTLPDDIFLPHSKTIFPQYSSLLVLANFANHLADLMPYPKLSIITLYDYDISLDIITYI